MEVYTDTLKACKSAVSSMQHYYHSTAELSVKSSNMQFEIFSTSESFSTYCTNECFQTSMYSAVPLEFPVACKKLSTLVTLEFIQSM